MRGPARSPSSAVGQFYLLHENSTPECQEQLRLKVADACRKSSSTVYRVLRESENSPGETKKFITPHKKKTKKKGKK
ncbi:hypothetical protein J6590_106038 [Homalodisca vitripennis]|nr:hypothetical protein J6590_106038 [Homalodisca vitripennis]